MLIYKSTTSRDSFVFTWGGQGFFRRGAIRFEVVAEIWNGTGRAIDTSSLLDLPEADRAPALLALVAYFQKCDGNVWLLGKPSWLPNELAAKVIEIKETEMEAPQP